jgi:uncharacterized repeat protein (TIGR03803 family)
LYSFTGGADGDTPISTLIQATDGNFFGTTSYGGGAHYSCGTAFKITPSGTLTTLHSFDLTDGCSVYAGLIQSTDGGFYGTTFSGGTSKACRYGCGTVYSLSVGLGPFVETVPTSGNVGAAVRILGTNLKGATSVTFNGTPATFQVISKSEIETSVPLGATAGPVRVTTTVKGIKNTLKSNTRFQVTE